MDIERIQKINKLAVELMQQGLASNRDEAIAQAEKIYRSQEGDVSLQSSQGNTLEVGTNGAAPMPTPESAQQRKTSSGFSVEIEQILKQNTTFLVNQIKGFQEKIASMEEKIVTLRRDMIDLKREMPTQAAVSPAPQAAPAQPSAPAPAAPPARPPTNSSGGPAQGNNPRSGDYNDEDVSIEKFFYVGNK